jgi:P-type Ca2+ transporter type 2C
LGEGNDWYSIYKKY